MNETFSWKCPYCHKDTTIVFDTNFHADVHYYKSQSKAGFIGLLTRFVVCPNPDCKEYTIDAELFNASQTDIRSDPKIKGDPIKSWLLKPQSSAIPQPDYIPEPIRNDYYEACSILSLSPKAAATLARRCLQGMIRNFWGITNKKTLNEEINDLKNQNKVDPSTIASIDAIREIGNIGAHMEKDVNIIVDIDEGEAELLIKLLEDLFQDWYVDRHERDERNKQIQQIAQQKQAAKSGNP